MGGGYAIGIKSLAAEETAETWASWAATSQPLERPIPWCRKCRGFFDWRNQTIPTSIAATIATAMMRTQRCNSSIALIVAKDASWPWERGPLPYVRSSWAVRKPTGKPAWHSHGDHPLRLSASMMKHKLGSTITNTACKNSSPMSVHARAVEQLTPASLLSN